ncbi:MAG TPA: immunoglobulin-like domain-containing protein, partial [Bacteroidia bacterium]|nr:immunoglobulin-like domain-containing protein [Bacteroidia bacterium]
VYALHADNANAFSAMDYNNYNSAGNFVNLGTTNCPNIPILQASFTTLNQNSVSRDPLFTSATDLHTSINISGTYVGIDEDIDGDFRNTVSPVMGADEVNVPDNAGVSKVLSPMPVFCAGNQDVKIQIGNYGTNVIDSVRINWEVNGVAQSTVYVNTPIAIRGFQDVTLGSISFFAGETKKIKIWTSMPNGITDALPNNDSLSVTVKTGLKGTYTIGGNSPDYPDFTSAVFDLNLLGVCGPVQFDIRSGTYTERVVLRPVIGASDVNTITFKGAGKLNTNLTFSGTNANDWATLMLNGADYFIFRDMTISSMGSSFGIGILLTNQADSNKFKNITLQASTTSTSSNIAVIAHMPNPTNLYATGGNPGNGNLFDSLEVSGGYFGIYLMGGGEGQVVRNCTLTDQYVSGIYCSDQSYLEVFHNKISPLRNTAFSYSLNLTNVTNFRVHANTINSAGDYGMYLQMVNSLGTDPNYSSKLYNNIVSNTAGYAFYCENSQEMSILHNSFRSVGTSNTFSAASYFASSIIIDFRNNHIRNDNPNSLALEADGSTFDSLDYNNYYSFGGFVRLGATYTNLAALKAGYTQFNQNSQSKDPQFVSINNLHTNSFLTGIYAGIDKDIDGESRCPSKVSIGADDENQGFAAPSILTSHTDFFTRYPLRFSNNISSLPSVSFKWYIDGVYETDSLSFGYKFHTEGPHTVKLQAQRCIHTDSTEFVIDVKSGTPITTIIGNVPDSVRVYTGYTDSGATSKDFFGTNIPVITSGNNIDTSVVGTYYIWYVIEDQWGNKDSVVRIVKVIDDVAPSLSLTGSDTITIEVFADINEPGSSATDNYYKGAFITVDSSMVDKNVVGIYPITYTAIDSSANISTLIRRVKVVDIQRPVITLIQADTIIIKVNYLYFEPGAKVKDNYCKTGLTWDVDTFPTTTVLGDYLLTYTAEDCQGNTALPVIRLIRVVDDEAPLLTLNGLPVVYVHRGATYTEEGVDIRDNYYDTALLRSALITTSDLDASQIGNYKVCYQVTDPSGNISNKICRNVIVLNNVGVTETAFGGSIKMYPNPAANICTIELAKTAVADVEITIVDIMGRMVHSSTLATGETKALLNLENLAAGVYNVNISQGTGSKVLKLTVVK